MTFKAVLRVEPVATIADLSKANSHQFRLSPEAIPNYDSNRTHLNQVLFGTGDVVSDVQNVLDKYTLAHKRTKIAAEMVLTADSAYFDEISPGWRKGVISPKLQGWIDSNLDWLKHEHPGLASANLHLDEGAPHIHAFIVPVSTKVISYRRGSKLVTRVNYNDVFGDDLKVIQEARKTNNSELTKLGRMQSAYANAISDTGLQRGIKNSKATHKETAAFKKEISAKQNALKKIPKAPLQPSISDRAQAAIGVTVESVVNFAKYKEEVAEVKKYNSGVYKQALSKAGDYDNMRKNNERLTEALSQKDRALEDAGAALKASKELVSAMRGLSLSEVAERLMCDVEEITKYKNAIDLVKDVNGFTFNQSVAWLHSEFGFESCKAEVFKVAEKQLVKAVEETPEKPATRFETESLKAVTAHLGAIGADRYRVTLMAPDQATDDSGKQLPTYNLGKSHIEGEPEKFYTSTEVYALLPRLRRENYRGYAVFITPFSDKNDFVLVDDLTNETLKTLHDEGFQENILTSTSAKSLQGLFVIPKEMADKEGMNGLFRHLNNSFGDQSITGYTHPFRLAGFTNTKKSREIDGVRPFVRLLNVVSGVCQKAINWCSEYMRQTSLDEVANVSQIATVMELDGVFKDYKENSPSASAALLSKCSSFYAWIATRYASEPKGPDYSRADYMLAKRLQANHSATEIVSAIIQTSPNALKRHGRSLEKYAINTVAKLTK